MSHIRLSNLISAQPTQVYDYMTNPVHFAEMLEGSIEVDLISGRAPLAVDHDCHLIMTRMGLSQEVHVTIEEAIRGQVFRYRQSEGLFLKWQHTTRFETHDAENTLVTDIVNYELPFGLFGHLADDLWVRSDLTAILKNRLETVKSHFDKTGEKAYLFKQTSQESASTS